MITLLNVILPVVIVAGIAALAQPWLELEVETLSRTSFRLLVPAITLRSLLNPALTAAALWRVTLASLVLSLLLLLFAEGAAYLLGLEMETRGALVITVLLANVGAMGLPVLNFGFGEEALVPGSMGLVIFNGIVIPAISVYLALLRKAPLRTTVQRVTGNPVIYAALVGGVLRLLGLELPEALQRVVELLAEGSVPVLLVVLGLQLRRSMEIEWSRSYLPALAFLILARLALAPLMALLLARGLDLQGLYRAAFIVQAAMPAAILTTVLALEFDVDAAFVALGIVSTTLLSLLSLTLWLGWLR